MLGDQDGQRHRPLRLSPACLPARLPARRVAAGPESVRQGAMPLRPAALLALLTLPAAASAAERSVSIGSFDKLRVQGPFEVRVATGRSPTAMLSGDRAAIDGVEVQVEGDTLILRGAIGRWTERPRAAATTPVVVTLGTPVLVVASVTGAGRLTVGVMKGERVDLSVTGAGTIAVDGVAAEIANATVIGGGAITARGRAAKVRLMTNGPGTITADALDAGDLVVRLDGPGSTTARARYTASVVNTGIGQVAIAGTPKCTVKADAGGPVTCGTGR